MDSSKFIQEMSTFTKKDFDSLFKPRVVIQRMPIIPPPQNEGEWREHMDGYMRTRQMTVEEIKEQYPRMIK